MSQDAHLLKVQLNNFQVKRQLLSQAKDLCLAKSEQLSSVFITPDLSPQEGQQKNLRAELHRCRNNGEQNIVIRKGQIVSLQAQVVDTTHSSTTTTCTSFAASTAVSNDQSG